MEELLSLVDHHHIRSGHLGSTRKRDLNLASMAAFLMLGMGICYMALVYSYRSFDEKIDKKDFIKQKQWDL